MNRLCKGCLTSEIAVPAMPPTFRPGKGRWVTEAEFERRRQVCEECPDRSENTCLQCGCLINYRAALRDKTCPHPGGDRWAKVFVESEMRVVQET